MMTFLSLALLTALSASILAQDCSLCPGGESPLNGDLVIFEDFGTIVTCNDAVKLVKNNTVEDCKYIFDSGYAFLCGCPGVEAGPFSGLCLDGSNVTSPDLELDSFGSTTTCAVIDQVVKGIRNESIYALFADNYADTRTLCGCKSVYCQPCSEGYVPYDFLQVPLSLPDGTNTTCGDFNTSVVNLNSMQCSMVQDAVSTECGCPAKRCTICPGGEQPLGITEPFLNFPDPDFTCLFANSDTLGFQPNCTDQTETGIPYLCGCPNAELPSNAVGCTLCTDGTLSDPNLTPFNNRVTCGSLNLYISVADQRNCDEVQASKVAYLCGCSGVGASTNPGPPIVASMSPSMLGGSGGMGGSGGGMGGDGGMGGGSHQGMGMMTMFASSLLRSGNLGDMFPPRTARGLAM